jgi:hypothetical protein
MAFIDPDTVPEGYQPAPPPAQETGLEHAWNTIKGMGTQAADIAEGIPAGAFRAGVNTAHFVETAPAAIYDWATQPKGQDSDWYKHWKANTDAARDQALGIAPQPETPAGKYTAAGIESMATTPGAPGLGFAGGLLSHAAENANVGGLGQVAAGMAPFAAKGLWGALNSGNAVKAAAEKLLSPFDLAKNPGGMGSKDLSIMLQNQATAGAEGIRAPAAVYAPDKSPINRWFESAALKPGVGTPIQGALTELQGQGGPGHAILDRYATNAQLAGTSTPPHLIDALMERIQNAESLRGVGSSAATQIQKTATNEPGNLALALHLLKSVGGKAADAIAGIMGGHELAAGTSLRRHLTAPGEVAESHILTQPSYEEMLAAARNSRVKNLTGPMLRGALGLPVVQGNTPLDQAQD